MVKALTLQCVAGYYLSLHAPPVCTNVLVTRVDQSNFRL